MTFDEPDLLQISGLQHFAFCRRQWALIHIEGQWKDDLRTIEGQIMHERAHDEQSRERRGDLLILRGLRVFSSSLGFAGQCDIVEFHRDPGGVSLQGEEGLWIPYPVEYKRGKPKEHDADRLQLCAQAMCLEEMLCCHIDEGALYYGEPRRRQEVSFDDELRSSVRRMAKEMSELKARGHTPKVRPRKSCNACSLKDVCLPALMRGKSVRTYMEAAMEDVP